MERRQREKGRPSRDGYVAPNVHPANIVPVMANRDSRLASGPRPSPFPKHNSQEQQMRSGTSRYVETKLTQKTSLSHSTKLLRIDGDVSSGVVSMEDAEVRTCWF